MQIVVPCRWDGETRNYKWQTSWQNFKLLKKKQRALAFISQSELFKPKFTYLKQRLAKLAIKQKEKKILHFFETSKANPWKILLQFLFQKVTQLSLLKFVYSWRQEAVPFKFNRRDKIIDQKPRSFKYLTIIVCFLPLFKEIAWYFPFMPELFLPETYSCNSWGLYRVQMFS